MIRIPLLSISNSSSSTRKDNSSAERASKSYNARSFFCLVGLAADGRGGLSGAFRLTLLNQFILISKS